MIVNAECMRLNGWMENHWDIICCFILGTPQANVISTQRDMIVAELHPKIYGRMAGLSCMSAHCSSQESFLSASCHGQQVAWELVHPGGLVHPPWTIRLSGIVSCLCHPWESHTALFLTSLWFLSQSFWGSKPSSACQSLYVNLFSLRASSTSLPTALLCR